jgi:hypothetical protein
MQTLGKLGALLLTVWSLVWSSGCVAADLVAPDEVAREIGVVVTSTDVALTLFDVDDPSDVETIGLGAGGSPVTLAVRGHYAAVPLGVVPAVAVVDLREAEVDGTVPLPEGSGATGVAFANDSIALVANPNLDTVTPVNVWRGTTGPSIEVGRFPQNVVVHGGKAYVVNAELENFAPAGTSTLTVLDASTLTVLGTVQLSGQNAAAAAVGPDGLLYVIQSGVFGEDDGTLSVVDPSTDEEIGFHQGFGGFPGSVAVDPEGLVYVGGFGVGLLVWDSVVESFVRGLDDPVVTGGVRSTSGVGVDSEARVYALSPDCESPAVAHRLDDEFDSEREITVGICPFAIGFAEVEEEG